MNKYILIIGIAVLLILGGIIYSKFIRSEGSAPVVTGKVKELTITAQKDQWNFYPEDIYVEQGDKVILTVVNEDNYDHGIGIDAFGVSQRMPANSTIKIEFVVTQPGDFPIYCSVPCGDSSTIEGGIVKGGVYDGAVRGHFDMVGRLHVKSLVTENK